MISNFPAEILVRVLSRDHVFALDITIRIAHVSPITVRIYNMSRQGPKGPQSQAALTASMWGLSLSKSSLEDREDPEGFPHSEHPDLRPFHPGCLDNSERPHEYRPGGLHPIHIEDSLDCGRYTVIHKLGHGLSSTVWLGRDCTLNTYVAIKILTAEASKIRNELGCLQYLSSKPSSNHPGQDYISVSFLDRYFWLGGPNGRHLVLVSKASGPSVSQMTEWGIRIRESVARKIALQVTQGLAYLHSEGICHGNLTSADVLFQLTNFDAWSQEKVYEQLGIPSVLDLDVSYLGPSSPRYLVDSAQFFRTPPGLLTENIRIIDYGDSFRIGWRNSLNTDQEDRMSRFIAPENLRGQQVARPSEIWALGCIIYEIRAGIHLFPNVSPSDAVWEIEYLLGSQQPDLPGPKLHGDGDSDPSEKREVTYESTKERISQFVAEIEVEPRANSEGAMVATRRLEDALNTYTQIRPYVKSDPNLFWKPLPTDETVWIDSIIRTPSEIDSERKMWKMEKPLPKISSTEAEQLVNLLSSVLLYHPKRRITAPSLAKHPWFVEPVKLEASSSGKSQKCKPC